MSKFFQPTLNNGSIIGNGILSKKKIKNRRDQMGWFYFHWATLNWNRIDLVLKWCQKIFLQKTTMIEIVLVKLHLYSVESAVLLEADISTDSLWNIFQKELVSAPSLRISCMDFTKELFLKFRKKCLRDIFIIPFLTKL